MACDGMGNKNLTKITRYGRVRGAFTSPALAGLGREERTKACPSRACHRA
jgi:hypothetical protein